MTEIISTGTLRGVVMLNKPPIDKIVALVLLEEAFGEALPIEKFWESKFCTPEQKLEWEANDVFPIDIGDEKYHEMPIGSAAQYVADLFLPKGSVGRSEGIEQLVEIINLNNRTGNLKQGSALSVAWTLREIYELDGWDHVEIIDRASDVTRAFLQVLERKTDPARKGEEMVRQMPELWAQTGKRFAPFSVGGYMQNLWLIGTALEAIEEKVVWWIEAGRKAQAEMNRARVEYQHMQKQVFKAGEVTCIALKTGDRMLVKVVGYDREIGIRVVKNPDTGNALIAGKRDTNLADLATVLEHQEPGLWYYARETQTLINGGQQYVQTPPTRFTLEELCALLRQNSPQ